VLKTVVHLLWLECLFLLFLKFVRGIVATAAGQQEHSGHTHLTNLFTVMLGRRIKNSLHYKEESDGLI
jgi:hypothetical protein